jgi:hypothetical protein
LKKAQKEAEKQLAEAQAEEARRTREIEEAAAEAQRKLKAEKIAKNNAKWGGNSTVTQPGIN